ncbi:asparaginyl-tRNA synthetase [Capsaspora owczarzaki ATCC 30864]|uniref:asparagine--tRNA ligase n=2 Tax=Capsaspora owczarzaki (strain ATCC 30864) TaxID=595528 RepID=A0A0D2VG36_CAPO3|nr:asparaginyl-tRNA synthetase [Capsaspora owczarzaki ATCC 30864]
MLHSLQRVRSGLSPAIASMRWMSRSSTTIAIAHPSSRNASSSSSSLSTGMVLPATSAATGAIAKTRAQSLPALLSSSSAVTLPHRRYSNDVANTHVVRLRFQSVRSVLVEGNAGDHVVVSGWVRSVRAQKSVSFAELSDGSTLKSIQIVLKPGQEKDIATGACIKVTGKLVASPGQGQALEIDASEIVVLGTSDQTDYPLQKKRHTNEFLRDIAHLRARTNSGGAILRVRNALTMAIHRHFQDKDFLNVNTPIITSSDCEGAGSLFRLETSPAAAVGADAAAASQPPAPHESFFGHPAYLTCSGQLHAEAVASGMSRVYVLGPTFRAENSHTKRHMAEFYMLEAEQFFIDQMDELLDLTSDCVKDLTATIVSKCSDDLAHFQRHVDSNLLERLHNTIEQPFARLTYTEAVEILEERRTMFKVDPKWGVDLNSDHERFLCEQYCKRPVFITDYPAAIKPFYMRRNMDNKTVAAMDLLVPGIGELVGGSLREERASVLMQIMRSHQMLPQMQWYLDLRRYGTAPHGGFGMGFERLMMYLTGTENVRDTIPFPRTAGQCRY